MDYASNTSADPAARVDAVVKGATWPALLSLLVSLVAGGVALLGRPLWSAIAYAVVLVGGALLTALQRRYSMAAAAANGATGFRDGKSLSLRPLEIVAILLTAIAAVGNGFVFALEIARRVWAG